MNALSFLVAVMTAVVLMLDPLFCIAVQGREPVVTDLGIPSAEDYADDALSRSPWDMIFFEGRLYVGGGDYGANTGPVKIWAYDPEAGEWTDSGSVPDEEADRFAVIGGRLALAGTDPTDGWEYGNYYVHDGEGWRVERVLPDGIHNFDLREYDGMLFAALGVPSGKYPVVCSTDGGRTFSFVPFERDGELLCTSETAVLRVYDLIEGADGLYVMLRMDEISSYGLYKYDGGRFVFVDELKGRLSGRVFTNRPMPAREYVDGKVYFTVGRLYSTVDFGEINEVELSEGGQVADLYLCGGRLYALSGNERADGSYSASVWVKEREGDEFFRLCELECGGMPLSLAVDGSEFYIGVGGMNENPVNGSVMKISLLG